MERVETPSFRWRLFVSFILAILGILTWFTSPLDGVGLNWYTVKALYWITALVGLAGFAFGFRLFSVTFWRFYAVIFTVEMALRCATVAWIPVWRWAGWPVESQRGTPMILFVLAMIALVCVALLRHAELLGSNRRALG